MDFDDFSQMDCSDIEVKCGSFPDDFDVYFTVNKGELNRENIEGFVYNIFIVFAR